MPLLILGLLAVTIGVAVGLVQQRTLSTLRYRIDTETDQPAPPRRLGVVWLTTMATTVTAMLIGTGQPFGWGLVPLTVTGAWLAAVDLDVQRLPNKVLLPTGTATLLTVAILAAVLSAWTALLFGLACGIACGGLLAFMSRSGGGFGFGDVKLAAVIGLALGPINWGLAWVAMVIGAVAGLIYAKVTSQRRDFPFGPSLLLGGLAAALLALALPALP